MKQHDYLTSILDIFGSASRKFMMTVFVVGAMGSIAACHHVSDTMHGQSGPFIEAADGTRLFFRDWGNGQPVVFLAGWGLNGDIWEYQIPYLIEHGLRCIAYDRRGHGRSEWPGQGFDYDTLADDLAAVIKKLDLTNVVLIAHSMGSGEVARYLTRHGSERIARVVLIAPATPFLLKTEDNPQGAPREAFEAAIAQMRRDRPQYLAANAPAFFGIELPGITVSDEMIQWGIQIALQSSPVAVIETFRLLTHTDLRPDLRSFDVPTLIIHGDADRSAPLELTGRKTAEGIQGSELVVYENAPHGLMLTHQQKINLGIIKFIKR